MCSLFRWSSSSSAILLALGMTVGAVAPIMISKTASAQATAPNSTPSPAAPSLNTTANFSDVPADYWAQPFIQALAARNIITGFPDGTFGPEQPVNRAEFAVMTQKAFGPNTSGSSTATTPSTPTTQPGDIYALVSAEFTALASALKTAGLAQTLEEGKGPFTVFAPTDQAFAALPKDTLQRLLQPENREILARILRYHVVPGELTASELSSGELKTLANRPVNIQIDPATNQITVNDTRVVNRNIQAGNGVIHAVDQVLIPPNLNLSKLGQ